MHHVNFTAFIIGYIRKPRNTLLKILHPHQLFPKKFYIRGIFPKSIGSVLKKESNVCYACFVYHGPIGMYDLYGVL